MPFYDFECDRGHVTEQRAGVEERFRPCRCGLPATRVAVYQLHIVGGAAPDSADDQREQDRRALKKRGWDGDRAIEHLRQNRVETDHGWAIDMRKANACD